MNFKKTLLAAALAGASMASVSAHAIDTVMTVTSGSFGMGFFTGGGFIPVTNFGTGAADITDAYNAPGWNVGVAQQTAPANLAAAGSIGSFQFGAAQVNTFTAAASTQAGVAGGGSAPVFTGTLTNGATTIDLSSFFANWNGTDFNQGNSAAAITLSNCGAAGCDYTASWQSLIVGGPFNGNTGSWVLGGTIAAVPEASTYGMMIAGLGLVGFVARRRARSAV
jgi:hypothetical protein